MTTKQEQSQQDERASQERRSLEAVIRDNVIYDLGRPTGLYQVQVRPLWDNNYRVNVFVGVDAASARVADSFFLAADGNGKVLTSTPTIVRRY
jgi:hypothetical protein